MLINSLLDTDLYKFTMMQAVLHQFPGANVRYEFKCRTPGINLAQLKHAIEREIKALCTLRFAPDELLYLRSLRFIKSDFVDFLGLFSLNEKYIQMEALPNGELSIAIEGPWLHTILFEIPVLAIVNETWFAHRQAQLDAPHNAASAVAVGRERLAEKIKLLQDPKFSTLKIADYGTRRRFSKDWHAELLRTLKQQLGGQFAGTSNVYFAKQYGLTPLGTMAHEYLQAAQALGPRLRDSQMFAFESWAREYRGDLGIALSDVYGFEAFLRDFDLYFCKLFDGTRHDSGDPFAWGEKMIAHYQRMRIDPATKILVFSDGLTVPRTIELFERFQGRCQLAFGIGTNLTNDMGPEPLHIPLQIVIKMTECNGQPVAKISDSPGKNMCHDERYLGYLQQVFAISPPAKVI